MKKTELITAIAEQTGLSKKDAEKALNATIDTIIKAVAEGDKIQLTGFGTFEQRQRNARTGVDPRTGNSIEIPASKVPAFKAGKGFKDIVNQ
ncbi:MAG: HU family DNA-binding protein [Ruminococcus sp.]|nr:HU family DNA-binding protein [Ruminococcus sp.]